MASAQVIRLHADDSVLIARASLPPGLEVTEGITTVDRIPAGHKVAIKPIAQGEPIRRYGQIIGFATQPIAPGQHVHTQNCGMGDFAKDYAYGVDVKPVPNFDLPATFEGIRRADGRVQTYRIVGEDEADPKAGSISFVSPVARSLMGKAVGDVAGSGEQELEIVAIA